MKHAIAAIAALLLLAASCPAQVCNLKVVTDQSPDFTDLQSLVRSVTYKWPTTKEKVWAMYYWVHLVRRQTNPMERHGMELTDPIRQFNDYGFTMCSTVAGVNCGIWNAMGLKTKFWDISNHTVSECFYDDKWHVYDDSMSAIYTLCDGVTVAAVEDVAKTQGCAASGGKEEFGHVAKYHCLYATSANGWLQGADWEARSLASEAACFNPKGLMYRNYLQNWDWGHRYILNLREGETYTRYYQSLGKEPKYYVPNGEKQIDPETVHNRGLRGNGVWTFRPSLAAAEYKKFVVSESNIAPEPGGLRCADPEKPSEVVFKINGANVITSQRILLGFTGIMNVAVSTNNGLAWTDVFKADSQGGEPVAVDLLKEVNGAYEVLIKVTLTPATVLKSLEVSTTTALNAKALPQLRLGRNVVYVGAGDQTDSIVVWPDLQGKAYKTWVVDEKNVKTLDLHQGWNAVMHAAAPNEEAYIVFRVDAPRDITRVTYGGRFYNRAQKAGIKLLHSFDGGKTWENPYTLSDVEPPWDTIHYETIGKAPAGTTSVLFKYAWNASAAGEQACGLYAARMEVDHKPLSGGFKPLEVVATWDEVQPDRTRVERSHAQLIPSVPYRYVLNTAGADHPVVKSMTVRLADVAHPPSGVIAAVAGVAQPPSGAIESSKTQPGAAEPHKQRTQYGYSDGKDVGGEKWRDRTVAYGRNLLEGKPYTLSAEPDAKWGADPDHKKLTDGIVGPLYAGGACPSFGAAYQEAQGKVEITVDMGEPRSVAAFRAHVTAGWPWWDALKGEVKDEIEVLASLDGKEFTSQGNFDMNLWFKEIPVNHMLTDGEEARGWNFTLVPKAPVLTRWVKYRVTPKRIMSITEVQALDSIRTVPFDLRIALPDEQ